MGKRGVTIPVSAEMLQDSLSSVLDREMDCLMRLLSDGFTISSHEQDHTYPRVCDMKTEWGRAEAWRLFFKNEKMWQ